MDKVAGSCILCTARERAWLEYDLVRGISCLVKSVLFISSDVQVMVLGKLQQWECTPPVSCLVMYKSCMGPKKCTARGGYSPSYSMIS